MQFRIFGPYDIPRNGHLISRDKADKNYFWDEIEKDAEGLPDACGCYVFTIRERVWYIGMAEKQSFKKECFQHHKLTLYHEAINKVGMKAGNPRLLLIAKTTPGNSFSAPSPNGHRDIQFLEKLILGQAMSHNPDLQNLKDTKLLRELNVPGVLNTKKGQARSSSVQALKHALGL